MEEAGIPGDIIRAVKKIYSSAYIAPSLVGVNSVIDLIAVNAGVLQGGVCSPDLFNVYLNSLIKELCPEVYEVLAYADDIAILCRSKEELLKAMDMVEKWGAANGMEVNKKKSGVLPVLNGDKVERINGYPVKGAYKYLGIQLDN